MFWIKAQNVSSADESGSIGESNAKLFLNHAALQRLMTLGHNEEISPSGVKSSLASDFQVSLRYFTPIVDENNPKVA